MWWHTVTHGRRSEGETGEWSGWPVPFTLPRNMVYPALLPLMRTPRLPVIDWTDAPADLNGLVRFAERRNLVSARVPPACSSEQQRRVGDHVLAAGQRSPSTIKRRISRTTGLTLQRLRRIFRPGVFSPNPVWRKIGFYWEITPDVYDLVRTCNHR